MAVGTIHHKDLQDLHDQQWARHWGPINTQLPFREVLFSSSELPHPGLRLFISFEDRGKRF